MLGGARPIHAGEIKTAWTRPAEGAVTQSGLHSSSRWRGRQANDRYTLAWWPVRRPLSLVHTRIADSPTRPSMHLVSSPAIRSSM